MRTMKIIVFLQRNGETQQIATIHAHQRTQMAAQKTTKASKARQVQVTETAPQLRSYVVLCLCVLYDFTSCRGASAARQSALRRLATPDGFAAVARQLKAAVEKLPDNARLVEDLVEQLKQAPITKELMEDDKESTTVVSEQLKKMSKYKSISTGILLALELIRSQVLQLQSLESELQNCARI